MPAETALLTGRKAIITGGANRRGIGFATAKLFAQHGGSVAILDITEPESAAREVAQECGGDHYGIVCDVTNKANCEQAVSEAVAKLGGLDILINNAGITQPHRLEDITDTEYDQIMEIHVRAVMRLCQLALPHLKQSTTAAIVNLSSISAVRGGGIFGGSHYSAAKAAVIGLTRALGRELGPANIRVNAVAPSFIATDITAGKIDTAAQEKIAAGTPLQRVGQVEDVAGVLLFLASNLSSYVTGEVINITGGSHIG